MNQTYDLENPLQIVKTQVIAKYKIQQIMVNLFSGCSIAISLFDSDDKMVEDIMLEMSQTDYEQWNNDDNYIVTWINTQLTQKYST